VPETLIIAQKLYLTWKITLIYSLLNINKADVKILGFSGTTMRGTVSISRLHQISHSLPGKAVYQARGIGHFSLTVGSLARMGKAINDGTTRGH